MSRRALLIVNVDSRSGRESLDRIVDALRRAGIEPDHGSSGEREALSPLIAERGPDNDMILVAGGDGTMNAAAAGLLAAGRPFGLIPTGTANDLARTLGVPDDVEGAVAIAAAGATRRIDLGMVNDRPFFNVASIGLSVELAKELTSDLKARFGKLGYPLAAIRALGRAKPFRAKIVQDGRRVRTLTLQIAVGNGRFYGGGNVVDENAEIDSGKLCLYSLEFVRTWRLLLMLKALRLGRHGSWKEIRAMSGEAFEVETHRPREVNADGEILTKTPARFEVKRKALEVFVPREG